jgi:hypothetical protein
LQLPYPQHIAAVLLGADHQANKQTNKQTNKKLRGQSDQHHCGGVPLNVTRLPTIFIIYSWGIKLVMKPAHTP